MSGPQGRRAASMKQIGIGQPGCSFNPVPHIADLLPAVHIYSRLIGTAEEAECRTYQTLLAIAVSHAFFLRYLNLSERAAKPTVAAICLNCLYLLLFLGSRKLASCSISNNTGMNTRSGFLDSFLPVNKLP